MGKQFQWTARARRYVHGVHAAARGRDEALALRTRGGGKRAHRRGHEHGGSVGVGQRGAGAAWSGRQHAAAHADEGGRFTWYPTRF